MTLLVVIGKLEFDLTEFDLRTSRIFLLPSKEEYYNICLLLFLAKFKYLKDFLAHADFNSFI